MQEGGDAAVGGEIAASHLTYSAAFGSCSVIHNEEPQKENIRSGCRPLADCEDITRPATKCIVVPVAPNTCL